MSRITVGIPAYKATYLSQAIASVLAQTLTDFELLISDDCPDGSVRAVVAQFADPRIRVIEGPRQGLVPNSRHIWDQASCDLLKFVYDDDFLLPFALAELSNALSADPSYTYAFSFRHNVDAAGRILSSPEPFASKAATRFEAPIIATHIISKIRNPVGEPSNILIRRSAFPDSSCLAAYCGIPIRHLIDVAFYMNAARRGPCVGTPAFHAAFRKHPEQVSMLRKAPAFSAGLYEWEICMRGAVQSGLLPPATAAAGLTELTRAYTLFQEGYPELVQFRSKLPALRALLEAGETQVLTDEFYADLRSAEALIAARVR
jgi:glycosyltransferase involved in cell wall biosynthesis